MQFCVSHLHNLYQQCQTPVSKQHSCTHVNQVSVRVSLFYRFTSASKLERTLSLLLWIFFANSSPKSGRFFFLQLVEYPSSLNACRQLKYCHCSNKFKKISLTTHRIKTFNAGIIYQRVPSKKVYIMLNTYKVLCGILNALTQASPIIKMQLLSTQVLGVE